jgi:hypothetical protein
MGFEDVFDIHQDVLAPCGTVSDLATITPEMDETRRQVLEAHKTLVQLSPKNNDQFTDLIQALESGC